MTHETHVDVALASATLELSLQELQTVSGGNYLDNMGSLNAFVASRVLPRINIAKFIIPTPQPVKTSLAFVR